MLNKNINNLSEASGNLASNAVKMANQSHHNPDMQELLAENLKYAKAIYWSTEKIRRYILWQRIFTLIKILIIVVPLIFAAFYLPSLLKGFGPYLDLLQK